MDFTRRTRFVFARRVSLWRQNNYLPQEHYFRAYLLTRAHGERRSKMAALTCLSRQPLVPTISIHHRAANNSSARVCNKARHSTALVVRVSSSEKGINADPSCAVLEKKRYLKPHKNSVSGSVSAAAFVVLCPCIMAICTTPNVEYDVFLSKARSDKPPLTRLTNEKKSVSLFD